MTDPPLSAAFILALVPAIPASAQQSGTGTESYAMTVSMLTADNCPVLCPCVFGQEPTHGRCLFVGAGAIEDGKIGETSLKGVKWGIIGEFTGEVRSGPKFGFHAYYVDNRASAEQKEAMKRILSSSPWSDFGESLGIVEVPIEVEVGKAPIDKWSFRIGEKGSFTSEPLRGGVDPSKPLVIQNPYGAFPGEYENILGKAVGEFSDHGKTLSLKGNSGEHHHFTAKGTVPAKAAPASGKKPG